MSEETWRVVGMTCEHCVASVTEEVSELPGVTRVEVTLDTGALRIVADPAPAEDDVRRAVEVAGYRLDR